MGHSAKITSILHLQTAVYYALLAQSQGCLRTKTVHSEILWALNPSNNVCVSAPTKPTYFSVLHLQISEAIRRYGVSDSTSSLFVVEIGVLPSHHDKAKAIVNGTVSPFSQLAEITDWTSIKKVRYTRTLPHRPQFLQLEQYHKLNGELAIQHIRDEATAYAVIDEIVVSTVAMKCVSQ